MTIKLPVFAFAALCLIGLSACGLANKPQTHGHFLPEDWEEVIEIGADTQETIRTKLGAPSLVPSSQPNVWLYMQSKKSTNAWNNKKELERHMLVLYFKENGELRAVKAKNLADGMFIEPAAGRTPTPIEKPSLFQGFKNLLLRRD